MFIISDKGVNNINRVKDIGKNLFQVRFIKLSYRIRGYVARTQINKVANIIIFIRVVKLISIIEFPIIITAINILIAKILVYSAIKIIANNPLLYSTLNPDTSSDSPSAK